MDYDHSGWPGCVFVDDVHFGASPNGESFGRISELDHQLAPMLDLTLGQANSAPRVGPLIISEINHSPADPTINAILLDPTISVDDLEFVEIHNPTVQSVDLTNWRLRGGIGFEFDNGVLLSPGETIVVLPFNPGRDDNQAKVNAFRSQYGIPANTRLLGGYSGNLRDGGERVELQRPDEPPVEEPDFIPRLSEDFVIYDALAPWPNDAGQSINRLSNSSYGNAASSWISQIPSPGVHGDSTDYDLNSDGSVDIGDVDAICVGIHGNDERFDLNSDGILSRDDVLFLVRNVLRTDAGDVNGDRVFNSTDLIAVFTAGQYEDGIDGNSLWSTGDWDCDGNFTTGDLVEAFRSGGYSSNATAAAKTEAIDADVAAAMESAQDIRFSKNDDELNHSGSEASKSSQNRFQLEPHTMRALDSLFENDSEFDAFEYAEQEKSDMKSA